MNLSFNFFFNFTFLLEFFVKSYRRGVKISKIPFIFFRGKKKKRNFFLQALSIGQDLL
jgi:hypothetical protein